MNTEADFDPHAVPIKPAATVIPLRDSAAGIEVLVLRRDDNLAFHGGSWVFPGGRLDPEDFRAARSEREEDAARFAAVREAKEEADLDIHVDDLVALSHWTTPLGRNRRFSTSFFAVAVPDGAAGEVTIDDGEIRAFEWHTIEVAIRGCEAGEIQLAGPTYVSLLDLSHHRAVDDALEAIRRQPYRVFRPRVLRGPDGQFSVYEGDPAYQSGDLDAPGPRHRMQMLERGYFYIDEIG